MNKFIRFILQFLISTSNPALEVPSLFPCMNKFRLSKAEGPMPSALLKIKFLISNFQDFRPRISEHLFTFF